MAKRLSAEEIAARNVEVVAGKIRKESDEHIAKRLGLSQRQVQRVWSQHRKSGTLSPQDEKPLDYVKEQIESFHALRSILAERMVRAENSSALVGIVRAIMDLMDRETGLRQALGFFPRNLGQLQVQMDVEWVSHKLITILEENDTPDSVIEKIAEVFAAGPEGEPSMN